MWKASVRWMYSRLRNLTGLEKDATEITDSYEETTAQRHLLAPTDSLCAITDVGRVRDHNEDTFHISGDSQVLIVADGMGGYAAGEVASALAVQTLDEQFADAPHRLIDADAAAIEQFFLASFKAAHHNVIEAGQNRQECHGMGTTLLAAYIHDSQLYTFHVGDVRCYVRSAAGLEQITRDHSVVDAMVRSGKLTREGARAHPQKHEILQAIGLPHGIVPEVNTKTLINGDRVLLCSDGLWAALEDEEIGAILDSDGSMRQLATQLVNRANDAGGYDNITVVLYEYRS